MRRPALSPKIRAGFEFCHDGGPGGDFDGLGGPESDLHGFIMIAPQVVGHNHDETMRNKFNAAYSMP